MALTQRKSQQSLSGERNWLQRLASLSFSAFWLVVFVISATPTKGQVGPPADPICRLRNLPDGATITGKLEYDVKAALLFRCLELVQWPADAFDSSPSKLRIGIVGKNQFGDSLDYLSGKTIGGRKLVVKNVSRLRRSYRFHLIFVSSSEFQKTPDIISSLAGQPVATIGETPDFTEHGGMISLILEGKNIHFQINQSAAEKAGIVLDPKLIKVAEAASTPAPEQDLGNGSPLKASQAQP